MLAKNAAMRADYGGAAHEPAKEPIMRTLAGLAVTATLLLGLPQSAFVGLAMVARIPKANLSRNSGGPAPTIV